MYVTNKVVITHLDKSLSTRNNLYWAFQQPVRLFQKGHASMWQEVTFY